jgi:L-alanine-DL-glutamate epimerase-like enolase superfamily enzyme
MKIVKFEDLHCDAGWRTFSFLKVTTDDGLIGWSEYTEADGSTGLTSVIHGMAEALIGQDPRPVQAISSLLYIKTQQAPNGVNQRAIAAIENALLDIKGKALGVPVYELFGGPVRTRIPVYWSHCGTYRVRSHNLVGEPPCRTYDDIAALGAEVKAKGFKALKTNILAFDGEKLTGFGPALGAHRVGRPERDNRLLRGLSDQLSAIRTAIGPEMGIHLDINFNFKTEGFKRIAETVAPFNLTWLEIDTWDPRALSLIRSQAPCPIASHESVTGRRAFRPFLDAYAADVAIIDVIWNGFSRRQDRLRNRGLRGQRRHVIVRPSLLRRQRPFLRRGAQLQGAEVDIDSVSWRDELFVNAPVIENGELLLPTGPGWGVDVNDAAVRAHPPK